MFIADFYCAKCKLVIEIDGGVHDERQNPIRLRDYIMNTKGLTVPRITKQKITENLNYVLQSISKHLLPKPSCDLRTSLSTSPQGHPLFAANR